MVIKDKSKKYKVGIKWKPRLNKVNAGGKRQKFLIRLSPVILFS